jgi:hypothetical protein
VSSTETRYVGPFVPNASGEFVLHVRVDPTPWESVLITLEEASAEPSSPGPPAWSPAA